jgi:hypothetical protein
MLEQFHFRHFGSCSSQYLHLVNRPAPVEIRWTPTRTFHPRAISVHQFPSAFCRRICIIARKLDAQCLDHPLALPLFRQRALTTPWRVISSQLPTRPSLNFNRCRKLIRSEGCKKPDDTLVVAKIYTFGWPFHFEVRRYRQGCHFVVRLRFFGSTASFVFCRSISFPTYHTRYTEVSLHI